MEGQKHIAGERGGRIKKNEDKANIWSPLEALVVEKLQRVKEKKSFCFMSIASPILGQDTDYTSI